MTAYGTNNLDWMILSTTGGIFTRYLQVQVAGSFTAEQLDALWLLNANYRGISKTTSVNYETELVRKECLNERIKPIVLPYVVPPDEDDDDVALRDLISLPPDVEMEVKLLMLEHQYNEAVIEYSDTYNAVLKRCDRIGRFNWETSTFDD